MRTSLSQYENQYMNRKLVAQRVSLGVGVVGSSHIATVVSGYNSQLNRTISTLSEKSSLLNSKLSQNLSVDPYSDALRSKGVDLAWEYEKADIEMGGRGSNNWNYKERQEILANGSVRGAEGHHQKNVADHPEDQVNPDNIKFYRSHEEHRVRAHNGNWRNSTDAPHIDKKRMLQRTNQRRIIKKELQGIGLVAAISFGIGSSIEVVCTLAVHGVSVDNVKAAMLNGVKTGLKSATIGVLTYGVTRGVSFVVQQMFNVGKKFAQTSAFTIVGMGFALYEFAQMKKMGYSTRYAAVTSGKSFLLGLFIFSLSFIPYCGKYLSVTASVIYIASNIAKNVQEKKFLQELETKTMLWSAPVFIGG